MQIFYALYELESFNSSSCLKRQGALLKIHFQPNLVGYSDCHPWPELGDLSLEEQLNQLSLGHLTPITRCAIELAQIDAQARFEGKRILNQPHLPLSHYLISDICKWTSHKIGCLMQQGYTHVKIKIGDSLKEEIQSCSTLFSSRTLLKLRFDCNERLNCREFLVFLEQMKKLQDCIDFIEDPFPFDPLEWRKIQQDGWKLACDRQALLAFHQPESASFLIFKPAYQLLSEWKTNKEQITIVTSYMGHPLGQLGAVYAALQVDPYGRFIHGLHSHLVYQPSIFSRQLNWNTPQFIAPLGKGFGYDHEFETMEWKMLR